MPFLGNIDGMRDALRGLKEVPRRVPVSAAARIKPAMDRYFAPSAGHGWAPNLETTLDGDSVLVDSGSPARVPAGIPEDLMAQGFLDAFEEELAK